MSNHNLQQKREISIANILIGASALFCLLLLLPFNALASIDVIGNNKFNFQSSQSTATITSLENDTYNALTTTQFEAICPDATNNEYYIVLWQAETYAATTPTVHWHYNTNNGNASYIANNTFTAATAAVIEANSNGKVNTTAFTNAKVACIHITTTTTIRDLKGNIATALHPNAQTTTTSITGLGNTVIGSWVTVIKDNLITLLGFLAAFMGIGFIIRKVFGKIRS